MRVVDAAPECRCGRKDARSITKQWLRVDASAELSVSADGELYCEAKGCTHQMGGVLYGKCTRSHSPMPNETPLVVHYGTVVDCEYLLHISGQANVHMPCQMSTNTTHRCALELQSQMQKVGKSVE